VPGCSAFSAAVSGFHELDQRVQRGLPALQGQFCAAPGHEAVPVVDLGALAVLDVTRGKKPLAAQRDDDALHRGSSNSLFGWSQEALAAGSAADIGHKESGHMAVSANSSQSRPFALQAAVYREDPRIEERSAVR
jgi:hypothetical protein